MAGQKIVSDDEFIDALRKSGGSVRGAAKLLPISRQSIATRKATLIKRGLWKERDLPHLVPDGYKVKGKSVLYRPDGSEVISWVKSDVDKERQVELMREVVNSFLAQMPKAEKIPIRSTSCHIANDNLVNCYILTDYHLGMMAWGEETGGDDMDLAKSTTMLMQWIDEAVRRAPDADTGILAQLGDFLHWDGLDAVTPASKHVLDADTRFSKVVRTAIVLMRYCISKMLMKYNRVHLIQTGGNHDPASTIWLREMFGVFYEGDSRVTVDLSPELYYAYEWGQTSLYFHHGHKRNIKNAAETFITRFRETYGRTKYSYGHLGHLHSDEVAEHTGIRMERHRTLSPPDAYSAHAGYSSGRDSKVITYHKEFGEVSRLTISPEMLK